MKTKLLVIVLLIAIAITATGCGSSSPSGTVKNFYNAVNKGDYEKALDYMETNRYAGFLDRVLVHSEIDIVQNEILNINLLRF